MNIERKKELKRISEDENEYNERKKNGKIIFATVFYHHTEKKYTNNSVILALARPNRAHNVNRITKLENRHTKRKICVKFIAGEKENRKKN